MKFKILAKLQKKFSGVPKNLLGLIAAKLVDKVTEESEIDDVIKSLDDMPISVTEFAQHLQKEGDRRFAEGRKKPASKKEDDDEDEDIDDDDVVEDTPASKKNPKAPDKKDTKKDSNSEISKLTKLVVTLTEQVTNMQKTGAQKTIAEQIAAKAKDKGIPAILIKGRTVEKEEDIDSLIEEIETDYESYKQEMADQGWSQTTPPAGGGGQQAKGSSGKVDPDVINFVKTQTQSQTKS